MFALIRFIFGVAFLLTLFGFARTWQLEHSNEQKVFAAGSVTNTPDGLYKGSVHGYSGSWQGKKFDAAHSRGINMFAGSGDTKVEKYAFTTSLGKGARDTALDVIKIEYDIPENPWWLRPILDEIVETSPGHYLGKLQVRIIPGYPFTLAFFELSQY